MPCDEEGCLAVDHWCAVNFVIAPHSTPVPGFVREHNFGGVSGIGHMQI